MFKLIRSNLIAIILLAGFSSSAQASYSVLSNLQKQVSELEEKIANIEQQSVLGKSGAKLAGGLPNIEDPYGIYGEIDLLYFKTQLGGTAFAYSNNYPADSYPIIASLQQISLPMDLGIGVSLERDFTHDDWGLRLDYIGFGTSGSNSKSSRINTAQFPLKGVSLIDTGVAFAKSTLDLHWNDLALTFNKSYFVSSNFLFKPYIGLKSSWIASRQWTRYTGGPTLMNNTVHVYDYSRFFGIGADLGNFAEWYFDKNFSLSGFIDIGLEYGMFKIGYVEKQSNVPATFIKLTQTKHQFMPVFDLGIDLNYGTFINDNKAYLKVSLGYEAIFFLKQNQTLQVFGDFGSRIQNISEDLSFHGLVARAGYTF